VASLRKQLERQTLVPGDLVLARPLDGERALVERREPRSFALERTTAGGRTKTMAANIDGIAIVSALARPAPHLAMIDELMAFARLHAIEARLILTKPDLVEREQRDAIQGLYAGLGYGVSILNPKTGEGLEGLEAALETHCTLLIGQSGVGKSTLFGALGGSGAVGDVSKTGQGKQTTTAGRLHRFRHGFLIDSPGVGDFELTGQPSAEVASGFVEFGALVPACRFRDCTHRTEPDCAVRLAVERGLVAGSRYASYRAILERSGGR
jgi:ribosome biogenesis GTPase